MPGPQPNCFFVNCHKNWAQNNGNDNENKDEDEDENNNATGIKKNMLLILNSTSIDFYGQLVVMACFFSFVALSSAALAQTIYL